MGMFTSLNPCPPLWYLWSMTETVTIRLRRSKTELRRKAKPNLNAWINNLIEQALGPQPVDWAAHLDRIDKQRAFNYTSDEVRKRSR